ncbi:B3/B4 domain-containing protein (DNA/RNA-binding domain of Phe-tRNA-synthetase) [Enterococcus malodoratus]|uniref:B3/B4 domain-containing protein n=1 Tax=Enterococcus malodoratus TaxID=71451 RepID=UPI0008CA8A90|nr:phenylalanine--tRNA ligase beta subunit-related protein [Enterococcus malodoratus]SET75991.1 B3/B4 domain-containing protein (DNA/RNA-binding domain of Phe-tRNA-synthetase) [Enterococcus malodoratus]
MTKFIADPTFWEVFPEAQINVLIVKGISNQQKQENDPYLIDLLAKGKVAAKGFLLEETFSQNPVIAEWRGAFSQFKTKKGARSSIEALLKRVSQDREFHPINPLVDIYNSISLEFAVPCGGEDLQKIAGDIHLGQAVGGESFLPLGAEADAPALPGEIIYYDNEGAICRCLNWREAQRTMLTETTQEVIFFMESINSEQAQRANQAMQELKKRVAEYFGVEGNDFVVSVEESQVNS